MESQSSANFGGGEPLWMVEWFPKAHQHAHIFFDPLEQICQTLTCRQRNDKKHRLSYKR